MRGQSIIEYALLAMLAIVGTLVMGPYLVRSVNAHFKLWQEPIEDSIHDPMTMKPTPPSSGPHLIGGCKCSDLIPGECGAHMQRTNVTCGAGERYYYRSCTPPDCVFSSEFEEKCLPDEATCCAKYSFCSSFPGHSIDGCCGTATGQARPVTYDITGYPPVAGATDLNSHCYFGEEILINNCYPDQIRCMPIPIDSPYPDAGRCRPICTNLPPGATLCPGADYNLIKNTPVTLASDCKVTNIAAKKSTAAAAGGSMEYTSATLPAPQNISVKVHSEDLNFRIQFFGAGNQIVHEEYCLAGVGVSPKPLPGQLKNSCDGWQGKDGDDAIDYYQTSFVASKVYVYIKEGGDKGTSSLGYEVNAADINCCPDYTANPNTPKCLAYCGAKSYAATSTSCLNCPTERLDDIKVPDFGGWNPSRLPSDHNWHCTSDASDPNSAEKLCKAFGYPTGYFTECNHWHSPGDNGYVSLNEAYPGVPAGYGAYDTVGPNGRVVHLKFCTGCAYDNSWTYLMCVQQPPSCN